MHSIFRLSGRLLLLMSFVMAATVLMAGPVYPYRNRSLPTAERVARDMACASMVLLKNEADVLPLSANPGEPIALVGPFATMQNDLLGSWTMRGAR